MVKATLPPQASPRAGTTLAPSLPVPSTLHHAQRGTAASYSLPAVLGSCPLLNPASPDLTPEGGARGVVVPAARFSVPSLMWPLCSPRIKQ